jgi:hypothetical protein
MSKAKYAFLSFALMVLCLGLVSLAVPVYAGESYGSHYPGGNEDFMAGALPPAGTNIFINYLVDYNIGQLKDNAGRNATFYPTGGTKVNTDINVLVDAMRFVRVTKVKLMGGDLVIHAIVPFGNVHASNMVNLPGGGTAYGPGFPASSTTLGDIEFGAGIAWHPSPVFHHIFAIDVVAPTGSYQGVSAAQLGGSSSHTFVANPSNLGRNYWSFNPLWAFTYIGDKNSFIPGFELSAKLMYWINTVNTATSYVSGQEFSADYLIGYHVNKNWAIGANGYFLWQTTNDKQFGSTAVDPLTGLATGVMGKELSIGPAISLNIPHGCLTFKYQRDIYAQNHPEGDKFWLKWVYAF